MTVEEVRKILKNCGIKPKKSMGQNFLLDEELAKKLISSLNIEKNDTVVDVGSGLGILTNLLKDYPIKLIAIEKDKLLFDYLSENIKNDNVFLLNEDILRFAPKEDIKLISNLPYSITKKFLYWLIKNRKYIKLCILALQKEVVDKILSLPGTKNYSSISVLLQIYMNINKLFYIPGHCFYPKSKVNSYVISLQSKSIDIYDDLLIKLVNKCFSNRRKKLKNIFIDAPRISEYFDLNRRPDTLTTEEYMSLYKIYEKAKN